MNSLDMNRLESLNRRYSSVNMTGFKIVNGNTTKRTVLRHFEMDMKMMKTSDVKNKEVVRVILWDDAIDICSYDNGTPVSYFFTHDARFKPTDIFKEIREICKTFAIGVEVLE